MDFSLSVIALALLCLRYLHFLCSAAKEKWTTEEEVELKTLYDQYKESEGN